MERQTTSHSTFTPPKRASVGQAEVFLSKQGPNGGPTAEVFVAEGTSLKGIQTVQASIYKNLLPSLGLKACEGCRSGLDILIRERYVDVIRVNAETGAVAGP